MGSEKRSILDEFEELLLKELVEKRNHEKRILVVVFCYFYFKSIRSSRSQVFFKTDALKNFANLAKFRKVLSCEYCQIFKNNVFYRTPPVAAFQVFLQIENFPLKGLYLSYNLFPDKASHKNKYLGKISFSNEIWFPTKNVFVRGERTSLRL